MNNFNKVLATLVMMSGVSASAYLVPGPIVPHDPQPPQYNPYPPIPPHNPYDPPAPPYYPPQQSCSGNICNGQQVIAVDSLKYVTVIAIQGDTFAIRDMSGNVYQNIDRSDLAITNGMINGISTGQQMIAVDSVKYVDIVGIEVDGTFVVRDANGNMYANIVRSDLAITNGSMNGFSTGQQVTALDSGKRVTIIAIETDGTFVVRDMFGNTYANIDRSDLSPY